MNEKRRNAISLWMVIAFRIFRSVAAGMIAIDFPYLVLSKLNYGSLFLGAIYTAAIIAGAFLGLVVGYLADATNRKNALLIVSLMLPLSSGLIYYFHYPWILFLAAILGTYSATGSLAGGGIGGMAAPLQNALLVDLTRPEKRTRYFSIIMFLSGGMAALGSLLAGVVSEENIFFIATLIGLVSALFLLPIKDPFRPEKISRMRNKIVIGKFTITGMLNGFAQGLVTPFLIPFFIIVYHLPIKEMSLYAFISGGLGALSLLLSPLLDKKFGFLKSIIWTRGIGAAATVIMPIFRLLPVSLFIYFIMPALRIVSAPIQQSALVNMVEGDEVGRALGVNQMARMLASSGATSLTGYLFDLSDIPLPFYIYGAVMGINIFLYQVFFGKAKITKEE
jgi:hypothetical protein